MIDYQPLLTALENGPLQDWAEQLAAQIQQRLNVERWGDLPQWEQALADLPELTPSAVELQKDVVIGSANDCDQPTHDQLRTALMGLHPWRKGPYQLFGLTLDTEWRSDWKWDRVLPHLAPLKDKLILDVGCGNGYHCWRMYGEGANRVIGIDPSGKFVHQFYALKKYIGDVPVDVLPLGIEQMPPKLEAFDTVFSMGVLYHRRSPTEHIKELIACLKPGGQLVLETLIINNDEDDELIPDGRYAKMRNVWSIPSVQRMLRLLEECGLQNPRVVDINQTSLKEQRSTEWMIFESLATFLDPNDSNLTVEGHPAPIRGIFLGEKLGGKLGEKLAEK